MPEPTACYMADPYGATVPCGTPDPCSIDGETTLWRGDDCAAVGAPPMWLWCESHTHPLCAGVVAPPVFPVAPDLPPTGAGSLAVLAAVLCALGAVCVRVPRRAKAAARRESGGG